MSGRRLVVEADGGSRGNPGPAGYGAVVRDAGTGEVLAEVAEAIGTATNNVAEYRGLLAGLAAALAVDPDCTIEARLDSKLVVEQMSGRWKIKHEDMRRLVLQGRGLLAPERVRYTWVPRARNAHADRLANEALDAAARGQAWQRRTGPGLVATAGDSAAAPDPAAASDPAGDTDPEPASARAPRPDSGDPTTLVLVRHGRTALTQERRMSGVGGSDPALTDAGHADARAAAAGIAAIGRVGGSWPDLDAVQAVLASPLQRTRQTAEILAAALGLPVAVEDGFAEASFGQWDGLTYAEVTRSWPELMAQWQGATSLAPPGGESLDALVQRVRAARTKVVAEHAGRTVAVVCHLTPIRAVVADALEAGPAALWRLRVAPGSLTIVRFWADGAAEVVTVNETAHLR